MNTLKELHMCALILFTSPNWSTMGRNAVGTAGLPSSKMGVVMCSLTST